MSNRYKGGVISATPPTTTGGEDGTASGAWTLEQQMQLQAAGLWPAQPTGPYIEQVFSTYLYTGNGSTQTITNGIDLAGKGGLVWAKKRNSATDGNHILFDTARGQPWLSTNNTSAQLGSSGLINYNSDGFGWTFGSASWNQSGDTYASWTFRKQPKFFDVVTYTGNGTDGRNIAHSLGAMPACIIVKRTDSTSNWSVYHQGNINGSGSGQNTYSLNTTGAANNLFTVDRTSSTNFNVSDAGAGADSCNVNGATYVAYLFASNAGGFGLTGTDNVISCGSYYNSGSAPVNVNLGYEPQWILIKKTDSAQDWFLVDTMRGSSLTAQNLLRPNTSAAEGVNAGAPGYPAPTATGFTTFLGAEGTFIYIAIRRGPMKVPTSGTSVFSTNTATYSSNQVVTTGFPVDMLMMKGRTITFGTLVYDRLRGLASTNTSPYDAQLLTSDSSAESAGDYTNTANNTGYQISGGFSGFSSVNWNFRRAPGFFDEVCYTGTGVARTVTHNLTVVPELIIVKARTNLSGSSQRWRVYSATLGATKNLILDLDQDSITSSGYWNNTAPTSTVFSVGTDPNVNWSGDTYVAYLFATCAGVSKVGSYTGTGALQTVNCGFTGGARFVLIKRTDSTGDWWTYDSARGITSGNDPYLYLNSTAAEVTGTNYVDTTSVGFQVTAAAPAGLNASGGTYIFLAIA